MPAKKATPEVTISMTYKVESFTLMPNDDMFDLEDQNARVTLECMSMDDLRALHTLLTVFLKDQS